MIQQVCCCTQIRVDPPVLHADTVQQFHENGYFADPQAIHDLAQYWEDQKNIDSLLGQATGEVDADIEHTADMSQQATGVGTMQQADAAMPTQHEAPPSGPSLAGTDQCEAADGLIGSLVNYSSSDDEP